MTVGNGRDIEKSMVDYLPIYYREVGEALAIIKSEAQEFIGYEEEMNTILRQFYIDTADEWGIEIWEKTCGILPNKAKSLGDRKAAIKAKIQGIGTMTVQRLKTIADGFHSSKVEEFPSEYRVKITIIGVRGEPADLEIMQRTINEIIPAHIALEIELTYLTWEEMTKKSDGTGRTWDEVTHKDPTTRRTWDELVTTFFN